MEDTQACVCSQHFVQDEFLNIKQFESGFAAKLLLKPDAVPSIFAGPEAPLHEKPALEPTARQRRIAQKCKRQVSRRPYYLV